LIKDLTDCRLKATAEVVLRGQADKQKTTFWVISFNNKNLTFGEILDKMRGIE